MLAFAVLALATGIAGGLARLGAPVAFPAAIASHGLLMICGFLGTVIALERAVALGTRSGYLAPALSALGAVLALSGFPQAAAAAWLAAALALLAMSVVIVARQPQLHTVMLAAGAIAWVACASLQQLGAPGAAITFGFAFLVLTIAAERLELTRLLPRRPVARAAFVAAASTMLAGAALGVLDAAAGGVTFGLALVALAAWLATFDIARRTVRAQGVARFAAIALLGGYAWLALGGIAWALAAAGAPALREAALHALGLGFVVSMILGHAPIVVPAVLRLRIAFTPAYYAPLMLLHASLALRLAAGPGEGGLRLVGAVLNAATFALLLATVARSATRR